MANKKKKVIKKAAKKTAAKKTVKKPVKKTVAMKTPKKASKKPVKKQAKKIVSTPKTKPKAQAVKAVKSNATPMVKLTPKINVDYSKAISPLGDRLVVKVVNSERVTAGGLIIPDSASMATGYLKATVLAVGSGGKSKKGFLRPLDVKVGDSVLFSEYSGTKVTFNAEELQIIHESDVMGIVQNQ